MKTQKVFMSTKEKTLHILFAVIYAAVSPFVANTGYQASGIQLQDLSLGFTNKRGGALGGSARRHPKASLTTVILYVIIIFVVYLFATSGLISNSNTQTQLKNGAYFGGLFAPIVIILIVLDFLEVG